VSSDAGTLDRRGQPLRVAVWHHLPSGGGKRALYDQVRGLVDQGHSLEAWCPATADRTFLPLGNIVAEHELPLGSYDVSRSMRWLLRQAGYPANVLGRLCAMRGHAEQLTRALTDRQFEVLLAAPCRWFGAPTIARSLTIPTVLYLQEPHRSLYEAQPTLPWAAEDGIQADAFGPSALVKWLGSAARIHQQRIQTREERLNAQAFDRILVNSRFSRESVLRSYGLDTSVCYLGIDTTRFVNYVGDRRPVVVSVGQFALHKNPEFIIRAVGLSRTRPVLRWIANEAAPDYVDRMRSLAGQHGVTLDLRLKVSEDELVTQYQEGLALLYAPRLEPFGYVPLEANACGMPVVAVAEGGVRETIVDGENGLLVDSVADMARAIDQLVGHPERARALGQTGAAIVRDRWTMGAAIARLEGHLQEVVDQRRRPGHCLAPPVATR
jgi:glycosyltransferase involved in cell wall biosynthesis